MLAMRLPLLHQIRQWQALRLYFAPRSCQLLCLRHSRHQEYTEFAQGSSILISSAMQVRLSSTAIARAECSMGALALAAD